jgi:hypothetical protein
MKRVVLGNSDGVPVKFPLETKVKKVLKDYGAMKQIVYIVGTQGEFIQSNAQVFNVEFNPMV